MKEDAVEEGERPAPFEELFGGEIRGGFVEVACFGVERFEGHDAVGAAALVGAGFVEFVGEEVLK